MLDRELAKWNLAVNIWDRLQKLERGYSWLAEELARRSGETVYISRIQKIMEQTSSPEWAFVVNISEILDCTVEDLAKKPSKSAEKSYRERFPRICSHVA